MQKGILIFRKKGVYAPLSVPQLARVRDCDQFHPDT